MDMTATDIRLKYADDSTNVSRHEWFPPTVYAHTHIYITYAQPGISVSITYGHHIKMSGRVRMSGTESSHHAN